MISQWEDSFFGVWHICEYCDVVFCFYNVSVSYDQFYDVIVFYDPFYDVFYDVSVLGGPATQHEVPDVSDSSYSVDDNNSESSDPAGIFVYVI